MKSGWSGLALASCILMAACANPSGPDGLRPVSFSVHRGYHGGGEYTGTNQTLFYVFKDKPSFDAVFSFTPPPNPESPIPDHYFRSRLIVAVVKIGDNFWEMDVNRIDYAITENTLHVRYEAGLVVEDMGWIAKIPLIFSIPRREAGFLSFYENGQYIAGLPVGE